MHFKKICWDKTDYLLLMTAVEVISSEYNAMITCLKELQLGNTRTSFRNDDGKSSGKKLSQISKLIKE